MFAGTLDDAFALKKAAVAVVERVQATVGTEGEQIKPVGATFVYKNPEPLG